MTPNDLTDLQGVSLLYAYETSGTVCIHWVDQSNGQYSMNVDLKQIQGHYVLS